MEVVTKGLQEEHVVIERFLPSLEWLSIRLESGALVDPDLVELQVKFLRNFVSACHHRKEEVYVFPSVRGRDSDVDRLIDELIDEHREAERLEASIEEGWASGDLNGVASAARSLASLLRRHIDVENDVAFAYVEMFLDDNTKRALAREMESFDVQNGCRTSAYEEIVESIARAIAG